MPVNLDALLRYHTIDQCLQNRFRNWTLQYLAEHCTKTLEEAAYRPDGKSTISERTIQNDIRIMRSSLLGYNAPIIVKDGIYSYSEKDYSIKNASLRRQDVISLSAAIAQLKLYKGLNFFQNIEKLLQHLESQVQVKTSKSIQKIIQFENIPASTGSEWLMPLIEFINDEQCIILTYKRFHTTEQTSRLIHPYFLKEYKNRWYIIAFDQVSNFNKTFALDRILKIEPSFEQSYNRARRPDPEHYYDHTIGVNYLGKAPELIILKFNSGKLPYIKSQPLHISQEILEESHDSITISLMLCINYELESLILSFADDVEVLQPLSFRERLKSRLDIAIKNFS